MCLDCGFYNGRQVMNLAADKEKREARMKAKQDFIKAQGAVPQPETTEVVEPVIENEEEKVVKEKTPKSKKPEKQVE